MFKFEVKFSDDLKSASVKFIPEEIQASAQDFGELIGAFASMRSQMNPPIPNDPRLLGVIKTLDDPRFWISGDAMRGGALLRLRDHGLGWLSFWIPQPEVLKMIDLLQTYGSNPAESSAPTPAN